jgi:hypothetical protein
MNFLKALIGGVIGAILATVALMYLRDGSLRGFEWFPLVTGLVTGLGARVLTGKAGRSLATGVAAALAALVAILAGDEIVEMWKLRNIDLGPVPGMENRVAQKAPSVSSENGATDEEAESESDDGDAEDSADESEAGESDSTEEAAEEVVDAGEDRMREEEAAARSNVSSSADAAAGGLPAKKQPKSLREFLPYIFSGLGVLIAYQLGRGGSTQKVSSSHHEESGSSAEQDDQNAEG